MFAMRLKLHAARNNEWRCCFCLHVRTATILLGIWHLMLHVLALTVLALIMRNHHVILQRQDIQPNDLLPTPLSKRNEDTEEDNPYYLPTTQDGRYVYSSDIDMGALMTVCTLSITLFMVYGAIKGKASHLLPFFCLQLFDFAITTLTATGFFCYLRSVHRLVSEHYHNLPFRNQLLQLSPQYLSLIVLGGFLISMLWKAYWIGIVWRCYKFLTLRQHTMRNAIHYILPGDGADRANETDYFRDQESAFAGVLKQTPPPSYQDIMDDQPPPYPILSQVVQETPTRFRLFTFPVTAENTEVEATTSAEGVGKTVEEPRAVEVEPELEGAIGGEAAPKETDEKTELAKVQEKEVLNF